MKKFLILFLLISITYSNATNYPISPQPLRKLVIDSQNILVGHVIKVEKVVIKKKKWSDTYSKATIVIKEILQGNIKNDTITIKFEPNMICPAPAMYYENTDVIAFVDYNDGVYSTHALSYGAKTLELEGIEVYKLRIAELQSILKTENKVGQLKQIIEWLVKCAENRITQWEGVFELSPNSNFMSFYSRDNQVDYKLLLSKEQKERLKNTLFSSNELFYVDFGLIDLVYEGNEKAIDELMLKGLELSIDEEYNWTALDYMKRLIHVNDIDETRTLLKEYDKVIMDYDKEKKGKNIILKFISLINNNPKK